MEKIISLSAFMISIFISMFTFTGCSSQSNQLQNVTTQSTRPLTMPTAMDKSKKYDRVIISGQPNEDECKGLSALGVQYVFNVRGYDESDNRSFVYFNEDSLLRALDIPYKQMPVSGTRFPYRTEVLDSLNQVYQSTDGIILIHCAGGGRAAMVYAGYQVKYLNVAPLDAMRNLESFGMWPLPLEKLTGIPMRMDKADKKE
jgi:protein tyrosine phosphatase (PTP) superfamily phosphohydrolase (DUF442 family)